MQNGFCKALLLAACALLGHAHAAGIEAADERFSAHYHPASADDTKVAVLVLGGSEGGVPERLAAPIIQAGFPVLALPYFKAPGLPAELEKIPLEYFDEATTWLLQQPGNSAERLIVVGWSKGAELALLLASRDPRIERVVAIAPSSVVWAGILNDWTQTPGSSWTAAGKELPHVPFRPSGPVEGLLDLYTQSLANRDDAGAANIPLERIRADVVLLSGAEDEIWPSAQMAATICEAMNRSRPQACRHHDYPGLDHLLGYRFLDAKDPMHADFIGGLDGAASGD